jgi:hypothetical protein
MTGINNQINFRKLNLSILRETNRNTLWNTNHVTMRSIPRTNAKGWYTSWYTRWTTDGKQSVYPTIEQGTEAKDI